MADILKVVAERWRELSENERSPYQQKALAEKELTQAKINEYLSTKQEEFVPMRKNSPQNKERKSKKSPKTLLKENVKFEDTPYHLEEPMLTKHQVLSINFAAPVAQPICDASSLGNFNIYGYEGFLAEMTSFTKAIPVNQSDIQRMPSSMTDLPFARDLSSFWKTQAEPQLTSMFSNDTIDLMNFNGMESVKQASKNCGEMKQEEEETTEATHLSPRSIAGKITTNDMLLSILESDSSSMEGPFNGDDERGWTDFLKINNDRSIIDLF